MPSKLSTLLASSGRTPQILDGALATYLETLGADISSALWSAQILLDQPSLIQRTHLDYYRAGANITITASYQASLPGLVKHLTVSEEAAKVLVGKSVALARGARDEYFSSRRAHAARARLGENEEREEDEVLLVAGSVGPYGAFLADGSEYRGDYMLGKQQLKAFHRGRMQALVEAGVDVLACETMPSYAEICALAELLRDEFPGTEAWFSFTLRDAGHISDGTALEDVVKALEGAEQVVALGVNCVPSDLALGALKQLKKFTRKPLVVYPNSGELWNAERRDWEGSRSEGTQLAERTKEYWDAGARLIGGCCRTTPADIKVIADTLRDTKR